eukprot:jgi/Ulvmu1/5219/UM022_0012.1
MTRETVRQWQMSRTQSVAHTLALMDRDGLFNVPSERGRSVTVTDNGGKSGTSKSKRDGLKITRSKSMSHHGSGRLDTIGDGDAAKGHKASVGSTGAKDSTHTAARPFQQSPAHGSSVQPKAGKPQTADHANDAQGRSDLASAKVVDKLAVGSQGIVTMQKPSNSAESAVSNEDESVIASVPPKLDKSMNTLGRQVSEAASMSGRAYARAPSSDAPRHSQAGPASGNGSVIIHTGPAVCDSDATERPLDIRQLLQPAQAHAAEHGQSSISGQDAPGLTWEHPVDDEAVAPQFSKSLTCRSEAFNG